MNDYSIKNENIFIVDDNPVNLDFLTKILNERGYSVKVFPRGKLALRAAETLMPNIFILDIKMPDLNGFELCKLLKANEHLRDIPVIFLSALSDTKDKIKAFQEGGVDYITKPFQSEEIFARIETHLKIQRYQIKIKLEQKKLKKEIQNRTYAEKLLQLEQEQLEKRIEDRTLELANTNKELNREIQKRKQSQKALQKAYKEIKQLKHEIEAHNKYLREEIKREYNFDEIIGESKILKQVLYKVEQVAQTDSSVMILGETGTGKELIARAIHNASFRSSRPLVKVNCAALPINLIESELFGHEKGAFSGANTKRKGRFEIADKGTLFLDEVAELPLELQAKLLRVIQDGEFERLGSCQTIKVDVRIIVATNRNMEEYVANKYFREDLWYRLNVFPIIVPSLRERKEDIPLLVDFFITKFSKKVGKKINKISQKILKKLMRYDWPGNIRELQNILERMIVSSPNEILYLPDELESPRIQNSKMEKTLIEIEKEVICQTLEKTHWRISGTKGAAKILGINPNTLRGRIRKYGIKKN